jgi:hypothetical protein
MTSRPKRSRRWCATFNNYTENEVVALRDGSDTFKYLIFGKEIGESGTPHLQIYFELKDGMSFNAVKEKLIREFGVSFSTIHIEAAKGNNQQNIEYCSKEGCFEEFGQKGQQGKRNDLNRAIELYNESKDLNQVISEYPDIYVKYFPGLTRLHNRTLPKRDFMTIGYWLYGETGSGKSRWAHQNFPEAYWKPSDMVWFDGYEGQETVIIDDYRPTKEMSFQFILRMVDRYPFMVPVKGAYVQFAPKRIIFTSPRDIGETFAHWEFLKTEDLNQMYRRFPHRLHFRAGSLVPSLSLFENGESVNGGDGDRSTNEEEKTGTGNRSPNDVEAIERFSADDCSPFQFGLPFPGPFIDAFTMPLSTEYNFESNNTETIVNESWSEEVANGIPNIFEA